MTEVEPRLGGVGERFAADGADPRPLDAALTEAIVPKPVEEELEALDEVGQAVFVDPQDIAPIEAGEEELALPDEEEEASQSSFNKDLVAHLIEEGSLPEQAPAVLDPQQRRSFLDQLQRAQRELEAAAQRLKGEPNREAPWYPEILVGAERAIAAADELVEQLPKGDGDINAARLRMLDDYFALNRLIDQREGRLETQQPTLKGQRTAEQEAREAVRVLVTRETDVEPVKKGRHLRLYLWAGVAVLLVVGRLGVGYYRDAELAKQPSVEFGRDNTGSTAQNTGGKETAEAVAKGAPIVSQVRLTQDAKGNLRAIVFAVNPSGPAPRLVYRWLRDDAPLKTEETGVIPAEEIRDGAAYKVEVTAHDGGRVSPPLMTRPMVVLRKVSTSDT